MGHVFERESVWYLTWRDGFGRRKRKATSAKTRRDAQALLVELEAQVQRVKLGLEEAPVQSRLTFRSLLNWYLTERCPEASRHMATMQVKAHVLSTDIADLPMPMLNADLIERKVFEVMERERKLKPATINRLRGILHAAVEAARQPPRRWGGKNPITDTRPRKVTRVERPTLTPKQVELVLAELADSPWQGVMAVAAYLGLRRGEIFALKKSDYDRDRQLLRIAGSHERETTKSGKTAVLPVPEVLRPYLERARRTRGFWLFGDKLGRQRTREADPHLVLRRALGRIGIASEWTSYCLTCERAKRPNKETSTEKPAPARCKVDGHPRRVRPTPLNMRFHDLRHTCATNLLKAGVPLAHVSRILRHSGIRITADTYGHLEVEDLRAALGSPTPAKVLAEQASAEKKMVATILSLPEWAGFVRRAREELGAKATDTEVAQLAAQQWASGIGPRAEVSAALEAVRGAK